MEKQIEEMERIIQKCDDEAMYASIADSLYNAGYRKQSEEELVDKIATYFEKAENWYEIKHGIWLTCGRSPELRRMLRESLRD